MNSFSVGLTFHFFFEYGKQKDPVFSLFFVLFLWSTTLEPVWLLKGTLRPKNFFGSQRRVYVSKTGFRMKKYCFEPKIFHFEAIWSFAPENRSFASFLRHFGIFLSLPNFFRAGKKIFFFEENLREEVIFLFLKPKTTCFLFLR